MDKLLSCRLDSKDACMFVPFFSRNILETSATALLARIDPFRVIVTYKVQNDASYTIDKPSNAAINWRKDIYSEQKPPNKLWDFENKIGDYDRALLSKHQGELVWKPAFLCLNDYLESNPISSTWISELFVHNEREAFEQLRSQAQHLFSSFSKGVHSETLTDVSHVYDMPTLCALSQDLLRWCSVMGLLSQFAPYTQLLYSHKLSISQFQQAERMVYNEFCRS